MLLSKADPSTYVFDFQSSAYSRPHRHFSPLYAALLMWQTNHFLQHTNMLSFTPSLTTLLFPSLTPLFFAQDTIISQLPLRQVSKHGLE